MTPKTRFTETNPFAQEWVTCPISVEAEGRWRVWKDRTGPAFADIDKLTITATPELFPSSVIRRSSFARGDAPAGPTKRLFSGKIGDAR
jgi:hypothetical protein